MLRLLLALSAALLLPALLAAQSFDFSRLDALFERRFQEAKYPGLVYGVVSGGKLVYVKSFGQSNRTTPTPVDAKTVFRIASMTKSFTVLAILKLRDEGKLSLEDPVRKFIPAAQGLALPTQDSPSLTVRHLLTHSAGFPEDNPWGDRQLDIPDPTLDRWLQQGFPFSTAPGTAYEYSNYGFALLGRIVTSASGMDYRQYLERHILAPLGINASTLEASEVPPARRAQGYGLRDGQYFDIASLPHGAFGAMGGLHTTAEDLAKYVAFHLSAFPPRNDAESGPVKRSSVREMQQLQRLGGLSAQLGGKQPGARVNGYGFGLGVSQDCQFGHVVGHGGGLPGFGSYMMWLPEYGVGMFAMANLTYAGLAGTIRDSLLLLEKEGAIRPRPLETKPTLLAVQAELVSLWQDPKPATLEAIAADNLFQDEPLDLRLSRLNTLRQTHKNCRATSLVPENWLRGEFRLECAEGGPLLVDFTLAPTNPPQVQHLTFRPARSSDLPSSRCQP